MIRVLISLQLTAAALVLFSGCAGSMPNGLNDRFVAKQSSGPTVYANSSSSTAVTVSVFADGGASFIRRLENGGNIVADQNGYLYITRYAQAGHVTVRSNQGKTVVQQFSIKNGPWNNVIAADGLGHVYVLSYGKVHGEYLYEYQIGTKVPIRQFDVNGIFSCMTTDSAGNLYLGLSYDYVGVYAPGSTTPERSITNGINVPASLAVDPQGNLFVANYNSDHGGYRRPYISVYAPGATSPSRTFRAGAADPMMLQTDSNGDLGVLNGPYARPRQSQNISLFAPGASEPSKIIRNGMDDPQSFTFDMSNNLYVANQGSSNDDYGSVTVYSAENYKLIRTITSHLMHPNSVATGP